MEIAILHVALIAKYFTTDKHFTYYLLSSEGWHFRRAKINPWGRCPIIDLVLVLVLGLEGQVLVNITAIILAASLLLLLLLLIMTIIVMTSRGHQRWNPVTGSTILTESGRVTQVKTLAPGSICSCHNHAIFLLDVWPSCSIISRIAIPRHVAT